jgi:hypothetical protein
MEIGMHHALYAKYKLEHFYIENVEMLWRWVPPPAPQA